MPYFVEGILVRFLIHTNRHDGLFPPNIPSNTHKAHIHILLPKYPSHLPYHPWLVYLPAQYQVSFQAYIHFKPPHPRQVWLSVFHFPFHADLLVLRHSTLKLRFYMAYPHLNRIYRTPRVGKHSFLRDDQAFLLSNEISIHQIDYGIRDGFDDSFYDHGPQKSSVQVIRIPA
ncbi:hypothetical protein HanHA89_Chr04g0127091 [Helianthus annuus]|nr:hypothetical protein HanHA89_Chr04g0127091 [Helianthus annuus]